MRAEIARLRLGVGGGRLNDIASPPTAAREAPPTKAKRRSVTFSAERDMERTYTVDAPEPEPK